MHIYKLPLYLLAGVFCVVLLNSCAKLPVYTSQELTQINSSNDVNAYYEAESRLRYTIQHDEKYVYLTMATEYRATQMRMLRNGVKLSINPRGKKKADTYLQYPYFDKETRRSNRRSRPPRNLMAGNMFERIIANLPRQAKWKEGDEEGFLQLGMGKSGWDASFRLVDDQVLIYKVQIPRSRILILPPQNPSIGIEIPVFQTSGQGAGRGGRPSGGARPGGRGGGMRAGGGARAGGRGRAGGMQGGRPNSQQSSRPTKIWFQLKL